MNTEENMILIESYLKDFRQYLDANSRCILSAKFGNGKSYFISNFIKEYSDDYLFIPIYPVNYQVMDNKDIFELVKRDILIRLLSSEDININEIELNAVSLFFYFFTNNQEDRLFDILSIIPDINIYGVDINISNVIKKLKEVKAKFAAYKEQFESVDKTSELYITKFDSLKGSIYEFDTISQLICDIICEYKKQYPSKQVVLIIEDLDRIDPGHIFRILNVFSAHFDRYTTGLMEFEKTCGGNKFCLDKIITVCDIGNIRNIYTHIYGKKTDFVGYISKFSSSKEFDYSLNEGLKRYIANDLLDKELLKYPTICDVLSDMIIASTNEEKVMDRNIRIIKESINGSYSLVRTRNIPFPKNNGNWFISPNSDFVTLLALLRMFKIDFSSFCIRMNNDGNKEIIKMIDKFWILSILFESKINIEKYNNGIQLYYYKEITRGIGDWSKWNFVDNCFKDLEFVSMDMSRWDTGSYAAIMFLHNRDNIADYINKELIV